MDAKEIAARRDALEAQRVELLAQLNATMGAIQDCEFWLARLAQIEDAADAAEPQGEPTHGR